MLTIQLKTNKSVISFRETIRQACEDVGLRLGKSHEKTDYIASKLLQTKNINEAMAKVSKEDSQARTLSPEDMQDLNHIHLEEAYFNVDMLTNKSPRTLLYGYHCSLEDGSSPTLHIYLDDNVIIHALTYNHDEQIIKHIEGESIRATELRPSKRAYPSATDKEFAFLLNELMDYNVSYTNFCEKREPAKYHGKCIDDLNPVPMIHTEARELSCAFSQHIREHYEEIVNHENFDNFYATYHRQEINEKIDPITAPVRAVGFSFGNKKELSDKQIKEFIESLTNKMVVDAMNDTEFNQRERFNDVFTELLGEKIQLAIPVH